MTLISHRLISRTPGTLENHNTLRKSQTTSLSCENGSQTDIPHSDAGGYQPTTTDPPPHRGKSLMGGNLYERREYILSQRKSQTRSLEKTFVESRIHSHAAHSERSLSALVPPYSDTGTGVDSVVNGDFVIKSLFLVDDAIFSPRSLFIRRTRGLPPRP